MTCPRCQRADIYPIIGNGPGALYGCNCGQAFTLTHTNGKA